MLAANRRASSCRLPADVITVTPYTIFEQIQPPEPRSMIPAFARSYGSGPPCRLALVHLPSPCGERRRSRQPLRWPSNGSCSQS
jgi:hypothetical protein